jgi:glycyl-tRNA synthetase beta chain
MANLLIELRVEELPPKALKTLGTAFAGQLAESLQAQGLSAPDSVITAFATPRRLAAHLTNIADRAAERQLQQKLMPVSVALDAAGQPTEALAKKLKALGAPDTPLQQLKRQGQGKAEALFLDTRQPGVTLHDGLQLALDETLARLPIPKLMSYQLADGWSSVHFVRPAHGLLALHGERVLPVRALGLVAGRETLGHRFESQVAPLVIRDADSYAQQLLDEGAVIAGFAARRAAIVLGLQSAANALGLRVIEDAPLLDEVTGLVERPNVLSCEFDEAFLEVPSECLILTMKANQKYFPLVHADGRLTKHFLVVSNVRPDDASRIVEGNQRVVRPRLADARFFFDQDRKRTLESRVPGLDKVVYHGKLGSQGERVGRVRALARAIGAKLGGDELRSQADRAALLAKADLLTDMVGEFPELQGIMGGYYARHDGEAPEVAHAVEDHYKPRFAGDALPRGRVGQVVALADKLETLVGLFGIGQVPNGDKDPFALRRHALGVIRILVEQELPLELPWLLRVASGVFHSTDGDALAHADQAFDGTAAKSRDRLAEFIHERHAGQLREQGYSSAEVDAVLSLRPAVLGEVPRRLQAVRRFAALPQAPALAAANKRVANILKKSDDGGAVPLDPALLGESAARALHDALRDVAPVAQRAFDAGDYAASLQALAALKAPVDGFFDQVMVNADDPALRANRLALLASLHAAMNRVADLSRLAA